MKKNKFLNVVYHSRNVGRLALTRENLCAFEYDSNWLLDGFSISPFNLPLEKKVFIADREPFNGNFGVFEDSLPDGWGRLLIDRMLTKNRINPAETSVLERLAIVGKSGMGALEYYPENKFSGVKLEGRLSELAEECEKILNGFDSNQIEGLRDLAGSSAGARPKVIIKHNNEEWIIKFRASNDPKNIGKIEYEYSQIAKKVGIEISATNLFDGKFFGIQRFDRKKSTEKIHMLSFCGLLNASHRIPNLDYIDLLKALYMLTRDYQEIERLFRLMCFNVMGHNRDDHSKNFSLLYDEGAWKLSPAYDLVPSEGLFGEHMTTIAGNGKNPEKSDILKVADELGIKNKRANQIYSEVEEAFSQFGII